MEVIPMREKQVAFSRPYRQALSGVVIVNKDVAHTFADPVSYTHLDVYKRQGLHQGISWAFDIAAVTERLQKAAAEGRFPRA